MDACRHCSDVIFKTCASPGILIDGKLCCQIEELNTGATCSQCGETLRMGHFALDNTYNTFWCEECLRELLEKMIGQGEKKDEKQSRFEDNINCNWCRISTNLASSI